MKIESSHRHAIERFAIDVLPTQLASHRINGDDRSCTGRTDDALTHDRRTQSHVASHAGQHRIARRERLRPQQLAVARVEHHQPQVDSVIRQSEELSAPRQRRAEEVRSGG